MKTAIALWLAVGVLCSCGQKPGTCSSSAAQHRSSCTDACCGDGNNPPTSGGHCSSWLPCRVYTSEQLRCQWIHNLEHGHLVLLHNCPGGCPEIVSALEGIWQSRPVGANGVRRALVAPDSQIPGQVAAVVWGRSWVGDAVDQAAIDEVIALQDGPGTPEDGLICAP